MILRGNFFSNVLCMSTNIQVLIPDQTEAPFKIVYLLHGLHGDQSTWLDNTLLPLYAKKYNAAFVMPEAGRSFYANQLYGRKYYDYISSELPAVTRNIFNISAKREDTAVMGCSMGGFGALWMALSKPENYGFCGAIAPACLIFKEALDFMRKNPEAYKKTNPEGEELLSDLYSIYGLNLDYRPDYDMGELAKAWDNKKPKPKFFTTCGTEDNLRKENLAFKEIMQNCSFDYTYEEWAGGHDWYFFNEALKRTLDAWVG